jgi:nucleotide-binding universal stress UspA family protein
MEVAPNLVEKMSTEARERLDAGKAKVENAGIACETIVRMGGKPHELIVEEAKARDVDLICMGTQGKSGLSRFLIGSVAQNVLAHAPCPVLVVPAMA